MRWNPCRQRAGNRKLLTGAVRVSMKVHVFGDFESLESRLLLASVPFKSTVIECCAVDRLQAMVAEDLDGDGDSDVLFSTPFRIAWFENVDGDGNFGLERRIDTQGV
jgi:hypothetical protein